MIKSLDKFIENFSKWGLVLSVALMLLLTIMNIVMRWFEFSLHWVDPMVRHLVFISAFLGGTLATGSRHHIKIDLLTRLLEKSDNHKWKKIIDVIVTSITIVATIGLVYASINLAQVEFEFGKPAFLGIHSGYLISIIPVGMALMSLRFILRLILCVSEESTT